MALYGCRMAEELDIDAMLVRFRKRADSVRQRNLPPVGGDERKMFLEQAQFDFQDFAMIADSSASLDDGVLTFHIDLRPPADG